MFKGKKIPHMDWLPIIIITLIAFKFLDYISYLGSGLNMIISLLTSFIWAFAIAYLLNPLMMTLEKKLKVNRNLSILIVYAIVLGVIILLITIITPTIVNSIKDLVTNFPSINEIEKWITELATSDKLSFLNSGGEDSFLNKALESINKFLNENFDPSTLTSGLTTTLTKAINFTSAFVKAVFGFIVAIYILKDKEMIIRKIKRFLYASFNKERVDDLISFGHEINAVFSKYIIGKAIDSLIIGVICFVGLSFIPNVEYELLISCIVGITNMIPYFGPFIGAIPAVLITLFSTFKFSAAISVLIFILALQQFDGWFLGPKILGSSVGLSPLLIILAIIVGGGVGGVLGMFISVPIMAIIKTMVERFISKKLKEKNLRL